MAAEDSPPGTAAVPISAPQQFPRGEAVPKQSPLYWVEQKDRYLRQLLIADIEKTTKRRLVVYFSNTAAEAKIDRQDAGGIAEVWTDIGESPVDLLLETAGGSTDATEKIISVITKLSKHFRAIVPHSAKSNGTLLCLAANSIVMGACSELRPIEPQLYPQGVPATVLARQQFEKENPILFQLATDALAQSKHVARRLLSQGMMSDKDASQVHVTVEALASRDTYYSHGSVIDHIEAKQLGLNVEYLSPECDLWKRLWLLRCMYDFDCRRSGYLKVFEGRKWSSALAIPPSTATLS